MAGHPRLYRRGTRYYHRAAIPIDIKDTYPKSEETFSLGTSDYKEALRRVREAAVRVDRKFEEHRRRLALHSKPPLKELSDEQIKSIGDLYYAFRLEEDEETRLGGFYDPDSPIPDVPLPSFEEYEEDNAALEALNRANWSRGKTDNFFRSEAEEVLTWEGVNLRLDPNSPSWRKLARELQAASIRAAEAIRARNQGCIVETAKTPTEAAKASSPLLSEAVEEWAQEKARTSWVPKTEREHRVWMGHFITVVGDRPIQEYSKDDGRRFKNVLLKLPANWNKFEALQGLPIDKAATKAQDLGMAPMSDSNVNKLLGFVGSFWTWVEDNYDNPPPHPFRGLKIKQRKRVRDDRDPFTLSELEAIFNAPLYTGCRSVRNWKDPGQLVPRDAGIFWVPLISLFTGARLGEVIQLYTEDVREEEGVLFFDINNNGSDK